METHSQEMIEKVVAETTEKRTALIESFVLAFLRQTGLSIQEVELVEIHEGAKIIWYLAKRGSSD